VRRARVATAAIGLALVALGCGGSEETDKANPAGSLTIYSSMPLRGADGEAGREVVNGQKLALAESRGIVNDFRVKFVSLDSSDGAAAPWRPGVVAANARRAVQDRSTIAYLGDFTSGASAVSAPITNAAGILQVSPASTYAGLTRADGGDKGEPEKYSPSGKRTFARVIPNDVVQAAALVDLLRARKAASVHVLHDRSVYGAVLAREVARRARAAGIEVLPAGDPQGIDLRSDPQRTAAEVQAAGAGTVVMATSTAVGVPELWRALHRLGGGRELVGSAVLATPEFAEAIGTAQERTFVVSPLLALSRYPVAARVFARRYRARFGHTPAGTYALHGYESLKAVLVAIGAARTEGNERAKVIERFFALHDRRSVLGTYAIDERGDTSLSDYGAYAVRGRQLTFFRVLSTRAG
jgi:branched-chain amino acid transport system substrate-binding protein